MKMIVLAPIEVEILLWRGSPQKIVTIAGLAPEKKDWKETQRLNFCQKTKNRLTNQK